MLHVIIHPVHFQVYLLSRLDNFAILDIHVKPLQDLSITGTVCLLSLLETKFRCASRDISEVVAVSVEVQAWDGTSIASQSSSASAHLDITQHKVCLGGRTSAQPVLRGSMAERSQDKRWQTWDWVLGPGNTGSDARLCGHELGERLVTDTWGAVGVEVECDALGTEIGCSDSADGSSEGVAGDNDPIGWVLGLGGLNGIDDLRAWLPPCGQESGMDSAP